MKACQEVAPREAKEERAMPRFSPRDISMPTKSLSQRPILPRERRRNPSGRQGHREAVFGRAPPSAPYCAAWCDVGGTVEHQLVRDAGTSAGSEYGFPMVWAPNGSVLIPGVGEDLGAATLLTLEAGSASDNGSIGASPGPTR